MWRIWGEKRNAYRTLLVKPESKKLHGRSRRRREDNIKLDLKELRCQGVDWIDLTRDRDKWRTVCEHEWIPLSLGIVSSGMLEKYTRTKRGLSTYNILHKPCPTENGYGESRAIMLTFKYSVLRNAMGFPFESQIFDTVPKAIIGYSAITS